MDWTAIGIATTGIVGTIGGTILGSGLASKQAERQREWALEDRENDRNHAEAAHRRRHLWETRLRLYGEITRAQQRLIETTIEPGPADARAHRIMAETTDFDILVHETFIVSGPIVARAASEMRRALIAYGAAAMQGQSPGLDDVNNARTSFIKAARVELDHDDVAAIKAATGEA
jgi:hypothetical protein